MSCLIEKSVTITNTEAKDKGGNSCILTLSVEPSGLFHLTVLNGAEGGCECGGADLEMLAQAVKEIKNE